MEWWYVLSAGFGITGIVTGVLIRTGRVRGFYPSYRAAASPFYVRNRPFAVIPFGCFFIAIAGAAAAVEHRSTVIGAACLVGVGVSFALGIAWMLRPPEFLKPAWLRARERSQDADEVAPGGHVAIPEAAYWALWLAVVVLVVVGWRLGWPWGWLAALAMGAASLLAYRPSRRGD